jgi:hypothetical protein
MNFLTQGSCRGRRLQCHSLRCWNVRLSILPRSMTAPFHFLRRSVVVVVVVVVVLVMARSVK